MPYFLIKFLANKEFKKGTLFTILYYSINNFCYQFLFCMLSLPVWLFSSLFFSQLKSYGIFPILLVDCFVHLMRNPHRLQALCIFTCPQQSIAVVLYLVALLLFRESLFSLLATVLVGYMLLKGVILTHPSMTESKLLNLETKAMTLFQHFSSYLSVTEAIKNEA
mmetsp:Transcript_36079/g.26803  ORF Transcript_36079/g.26803 Transcript_36079/m.26803 type:complete len:165 (+) Transcript_36079:113-607(+)